MSVKFNKRVSEMFKSKRNKGIAFVGLCVLACKIPILLLLAGIGGLGASASIFDLSPTVQTLVLALVALAIALSIVFFGYRAFRRANA